MSVYITTQRARAALSTHAKNSGTIICLCMGCGEVVRVKDAQGAKGGVSDSYCKKCGDAYLTKQLGIMEDSQ